HDVYHADQGLLGHACRPSAREGEHDGGKESEDTRVTIGGGALRRMAQHKCDGGPECRNLGERQIDKDHFAREQLQAEMGMDRNEACCDQERRPEQVESVDHWMGTADSSASIFASKREM